MNEKKYLGIAVAVIVVVVVAFGAVKWLRPEPEKVRIAIPPGEAADLAQLTKQYGSVCEGLGEALDMECELILTTSYAAVVEALRSGTTDVTRLGVTQYLLNRDELKVKVVANDIIEGENHYHSILLGRPGIWDEPFAMEQLKGKTLVLVDPGSTSGYVAPLTMILEAGLTLDDFESHHFSTSHPISVETLLNGQVDVAAVTGVLLPEMLAAGHVEGEDFVLLAESPELLLDIWVISPHVDPELSDRIAEALLNLPEEVFENCLSDGFAHITEADFAFNEAMLRAIGELE